MPPGEASEGPVIFLWDAGFVKVVVMSVLQRYLCKRPIIISQSDACEEEPYEKTDLRKPFVIVYGPVTNELHLRLTGYAHY